MPLNACTAYPLIPLKNPLTYRSATGQTVKERGLRKICGKMDQSIRGIRAKVLNIQRPLLSVYEMVEKGHKVVFDKVDGTDASYCVHKDTGEVTRFKVQNRCWVLDVEVTPFSGLKAALAQRMKDVQDGNIPMMAPFTRQVEEP